MKVVIVDGDDAVRSRARYGEIIEKAKKKGFGVSYLSGEIGELEKITSVGLFDEQYLYVCDNIKKLDEAIYELNLDANLLIWHKGNFPKLLAKKFNKVPTYETFDLPKVIFRFLDNIKMPLTKETVLLLKDLVKSNSAEYVAALLNTHLRDMWISLDEPEKLGYPQWRMGKLRRQAEQLGKERIERMILRLADYDIESKTGDTDLGLMLDLILVEELK